MHARYDHMLDQVSDLGTHTSAPGTLSTILIQNVPQRLLDVTCARGAWLRAADAIAVTIL
jgi:hypothetical protein